VLQAMVHAAYVSDREGAGDRSSDIELSLTPTVVGTGPGKLDRPVHPRAELERRIPE